MIGGLAGQAVEVFDKAAKSIEKGKYDPSMYCLDGSPRGIDGHIGTAVGAHPRTSLGLGIVCFHILLEVLGESPSMFRGDRSAAIVACHKASERAKTWRVGVDRP